MERTRWGWQVTRADLRCRQDQVHTFNHSTHFLHTLERGYMRSAYVSAYVNICLEFKWWEISLTGGVYYVISFIYQHLLFIIVFIYIRLPHCIKVIFYLIFIYFYFHLEGKCNCFYSLTSLKGKVVSFLYFHSFFHCICFFFVWLFFKWITQLSPTAGGKPNE